MSTTAPKRPTVYRMVMDTHICPYGIKSLGLSKRKGFEVDDRHLITKEETDAFREKHVVETAPQTWINDERIGGYDDLRAHSGPAPLSRTHLRRPWASHGVIDSSGL